MRVRGRSAAVTRSERSCRGPFDIRVVVDELTTGQQSRAFDRLTLILSDGGVTPELAAFVEKVNDSLDDEILEQAETALINGDWFGTERIEFSAVLRDDKWLDVHRCTSGMGAYPWTGCADFFVRTDTGQPWTWSDAIRVEARGAFLDECSRRLAAASKAQRRELIAQGDADTIEPYNLAPNACTWALINGANVIDDTLVLHIGETPHVVQALAWTLPLPREMLQRFVSKTSPLSHLTKK